MYVLPSDPSSLFELSIRCVVKLNIKARLSNDFGTKAAKQSRGEVAEQAGVGPIGLAILIVSLALG